MSVWAEYDMTDRTLAERAAWWRAYMTEELEQAWGHGAYPRALPGMLAPVLLDVAEVVDPRALAAALKGPAHRDWSRVNGDGALEHLVNEAHEQILNASPAQVIQYAEDWYSGIPNGVVGGVLAGRFRRADVVRLTAPALSRMHGALADTLGDGTMGLVGKVRLVRYDDDDEQTYEVRIHDPAGNDADVQVADSALELAPDGDLTNAARAAQVDFREKPARPELHDGQNVRLLEDEQFNDGFYVDDLTGLVGVVSRAGARDRDGTWHYNVEVFGPDGHKHYRLLTQAAVEPVSDEPSHLAEYELALEANRLELEQHAGRLRNEALARAQASTDVYERKAAREAKKAAPRSAAAARRQRDAAVDKALGAQRPAKAKRAAPPTPPVSVLDVAPGDALRQYAQSSFALVHPESPAPRPRPAPRHEVAPSQLSIFDMTIDD